MARLIPSDVARLSLAGADDPELETLARLAKELPNEYAVFHSLHWSSASKRATRFGEIDFVIVNRAGEILVIEQKNGALEETDQGLFKWYGQRAKSLDSQIQRNISGIRDKFSAQHGSDSGLNIDYLIYCPEYRVVKVNAAGVDMNRTVDAVAKANLAKRIQKLLGPGDTQDTDREAAVLGFFNQTFAVVPDVSAYVASHQQVFTQMVEGLAEVVDKLEFSPFHLRVIGTAGAGKSQLTVRLCEQALAAGSRPLLLCFNRPFADRLRPLVPAGTTTNTYYGFCTEVAERLGLEIDFSEMGETKGFWRNVQDHIVAADIADSEKYDYLVVDEGQDFEQDWVEILRLFLVDDASIVWLEDPLQTLRHTEPVHLPDFVTYRETSNFRSPETIATFIKKSLDVDFEQRNALPGLGVALHSYAEPTAQVQLVAERVKELKKAGFQNDEIVIVSCRGMASSAFQEVDRLGTLAIRRFTGNYDYQGNQVYTDGEIYFDTIYRFKGQQAPAIILVDIDETLGETDFARHVLYCGMTRPTVRLELVVKEDCPWLAKLRTAA